MPPGKDMTVNGDVFDLRTPLKPRGCAPGEPHHTSPTLRRDLTLTKEPKQVSNQNNYQDRPQTYSHSTAGPPSTVPVVTASSSEKQYQDYEYDQHVGVSFCRLTGFLILKTKYRCGPILSYRIVDAHRIAILWLLTLGSYQQAESQSRSSFDGSKLV